MKILITGNMGYVGPPLLERLRCSVPDDGLFDETDVVVHLAAISNDPMGDRFAEVTHDINFKASVELAKQAKAAGVSRFVFASSCSK